MRGSDIEYVSANFLYWSKRDLGEAEQLGFGICNNDELHGDVEYYYIVVWEEQSVQITAHAIQHDAGEIRCVGGWFGQAGIASPSCASWGVGSGVGCRLVFGDECAVLLQVGVEFGQVVGRRGHEPQENRVADYLSDLM